jgi:hypothetical protein
MIDGHMLLEFSAVLRAFINAFVDDRDIAFQLFCFGLPSFAKDAGNTFVSVVIFLFDSIIAKSFFRTKHRRGRAAQM